MLKVRTLFSGIGAPESALKNLEIPYELVDFCEVDKYAVKSYCAVHGVSEDKNLGDITKVWGRNLPYADLLVWGFPCQDISVAGKQRGLKEGETRSGLYYEGFRILKETKPKYSVIENVKNLVGKKFKADFESMLEDIESLGYNNYWKVLNAKDYGIPQNRERVFIVSIRKDIDTGTFSFPKGFDNGLRLKDFLEDEVDEKYYISQEKTDKLIQKLKDKEVYSVPLKYLDRNQKNYPSDYAMCVDTCNTNGVAMQINRGELKVKEDGIASCLDANYHKGLDNHAARTGILQVGMLDIKGNEQVRRVYSEEGLSPTLNTMQGGNRQPKVLIDDTQGFDGIRIYNEYAPTLRSQRQGLKITESPMPELVGGIGEINFGKQYRQGNRVYSSEKTAMCLMAQPVGNAGGFSYLYNVGYRIRKLTPKECWRLMGFKDEDFKKAVDAGVSNSQLYKQAGNSIVTNCLFYIFKNLLQAEIATIYEENKELS
ncbi:DNA (cytosine-5-)-methyltransferase [Clostridium magnum]|uniref:Cytosine-specific methyltransferase n=1 Tax=Clostridium magnum DSM 2767 TaxID=1121326 RepID=A0A162QGJ3_9CLOT|nr:DNA (cytosine-5-)-methyltransferase [Clostridium magnum]KZL88509.1 modification methylase HhaI [Clostridium magnum DSM 2767]SHJ12316.1 DNA (cytosine-5)-methyltransferase 1 [Clostridium magnum DSM 2767]